MLGQAAGFGLGALVFLPAAGMVPGRRRAVPGVAGPAQAAATGDGT
jgi:hypothetical protein